MKHPIHILDGGMSRELVRLGAELKQPEWSALALMKSPELVEKAHCEFIEAGAEIVTTNSFAIVPFHIGTERFESQGADLLKLAGQCARNAANTYPDRSVIVAGSLPPIFGAYEPQLFDANKAEYYLDIFVKNLNPFVDVWLGETLSLIAEGDAVIKAVAHSQKPIWIAFTIMDDEEQFKNHATPKLRSGETVKDAALWAIQAGIDCLMFNCSHPEVMLDAVKVTKEIFDAAHANIEIGVYANAFENDMQGKAANESLSPIRDDLNGKTYNRFACEWIAAGATMVGGCCGIGSAHIHELSTLKS